MNRLQLHVLHEPDSIRTGTADRPFPDSGIFIGFERAGRFPALFIPTSTASESICDNGALE